MSVKTIVLALFCTFALINATGVNACSVNLTASTPQHKKERAKRVVIKKDINLSGRTVYLPQGAKLICKGGCVTNGEIVFNETEISGTPALYCKVSGSVRDDVIPVDWFLPDNDLDALYENGFFKLSGMSIIEFQEKTYVSGVRGRNAGIKLSGVTIDGKGATVLTKAGGSTSQSLLMLNGCENVTIKDFILVGSEEESKEEGARHNISLYNCDSLVLQNIVSQKAFTDGLYIRKSNHIRINGFKAYSSGRQGCSITGGTDIYFTDCIFDGSYRVSPMAGLDIEPNYETDDIDNISITKSSFTNNTSTGLTIKLKRRGDESSCRINVENCEFDSNGINISVASAAKSGGGYIDIANCELKNSKWVSFQSKCYSADGTPTVRFHNSILENANLNAGTDVREQAAFISVHNISSHPLKGTYGNIELTELTIRQDKSLLTNIKRAISLYPDKDYEIENVSISNISFNFEEGDNKSLRLMYIPKQKVKSVIVRP